MRGISKVIAIKENVDLCPWADVVYGCDLAWWQFRRGLPDFKGLKISWASTGYNGVRTVKIPPGEGKTYSNRLQFEPGVVGAGGNSGFQALNLALQWGARRIILIGFDMTDRSGVHWYGRNKWPMANNPNESNFRKWIAAFEGAVPVINKLGADVVNVSPNSDLQAFRKSTLEQVLNEWQ